MDDSLLTALLSLVFPLRCLLCAESVEGESTKTQALCRLCHSLIDERLRIGRVAGINFFTYGSYGIEFAEIVLAAKEENGAAARRYLAKVLSLSLVAGLARQPTHASETGREAISKIILIPMPSPRKSERVRGYNHCLLLAREVMRQSAEHCPRVAIETRSLLRLARATVDQTGLDAQARAANLSQAFRVVNPGGRGLLGGWGGRGRWGNKAPKRPVDPSVELSRSIIVLVDDVMTTGSTVREAVRALQTAGCEPKMAILACVSPRLFYE